MTETIRDPKPEVQRIEGLAKRILEGDIILPKFQRPFVWSKQQVLDLLDSIQKNYPIGNVLLWLSRNKLAAANSIADLKVAARSEEYPVNYLLDGQQRLSSICGALYWHGADANSVWNIAYDLRSEEFIHLRSTQDPPPYQIRLNKISDGSKFYKHIYSLDALNMPDFDILKARADDLFNRFKDYQIATITLSDMPIESVAPIFERINSTGTPLTMVDLMRAATWSNEFDLIEAIDDDVLDAISPRDFSSVDRKAVLRNLAGAACSGFTATHIDNLRDRNAEQLKLASSDVVKAYSHAVDFLIDQLGVPNDRVLPYSNQMVVLSKIFRINRRLSPEQIEYIRAWFWRTSLTGYFGGWNTGQMAADYAAVRRFCRGDSGAILNMEVEVSKAIWVSRQFRSNNALSKVLALLLAKSQPIDLLTGQKISLSNALAWSNAKEFHHIFPDAYLRTLEIEAGKRSCIANFMMISSRSNKEISAKRPSDYLRLCADRLGDRFKDALRSNLISDAALDAAMVDDYLSFLEQRSLTLHSEATKLAQV